MKIFSYNVNGIRAAIRKGFLEWLHEYNPDIICLQEIKANSDQLDLYLFNKIGYQPSNFMYNDTSDYVPKPILCDFDRDSID